MTVPIYNVRDLFGGNGLNTKFPYSFVIKEEIHLKVTMWDKKGVESVLTEGVDYEVFGMDDDTERYITYPITGDPLPYKGMILLELALPVTQLISYLDDIFDPDKHEASFDYLTQLKAQQQNEIDRVQKVSIIHDIFLVLNEDDMGDITPDHFNPPSQSSVNIFTKNRISNDNLVALMSAELAPSQRADKVYADSLIDTDVTLAAESAVIAPSQKAALTKMIPYLGPPSKDSLYFTFSFTAVGETYLSQNIRDFFLDLSLPSLEKYKDRFTNAPSHGWCVPLELYDGLYPLEIIYHPTYARQSTANYFYFTAKRLDGLPMTTAALGRVTCYLKE
jgi:hypothetical protein